MKSRLRRLVVPALLATMIPATAVLAQTQNQAPARPAGPSREALAPEALARLQDGRMAMIRESLKLNEGQLKLWGPVEAQMRASFADRQKARAERREKRQQGVARPSLPDRLDRASQRMTERAERMKAFAEVLRPFYASLTDDQQAVAGVVLRQGRGFGGFGGRRWAMERSPADAEHK